jgi:hypothetical protein
MDFITNSVCKIQITKKINSPTRASRQQKLNSIHKYGPLSFYTCKTVPHIPHLYKLKTENWYQLLEPVWQSTHIHLAPLNDTVQKTKPYPTLSSSIRITSTATIQYQHIAQRKSSYLLSTKSAMWVTSIDTFNIKQIIKNEVSFKFKQL